MTADSKSKRKAEEAPEEVSLPVPDFDEAVWKKKEVHGAIQAFVVTGYGFLLGAFARLGVGLTGGDYRAGWIALLVGIAGLRLVFRGVRFDITEWKTKEWLGTYFTLFFSFLAAWYFLTNPPFG